GRGSTCRSRGGRPRPRPEPRATTYRFPDASARTAEGPDEAGGQSSPGPRAGSRRWCVAEPNRSGVGCTAIEEKVDHHFVEQVVAVLGEDRLRVELDAAVVRIGHVVA